jgi:hypothetical protein
MTAAESREQVENSSVFECRRGPGAEALRAEPGSFVVNDEYGRPWVVAERAYAFLHRDNWNLPDPTPGDTEPPVLRLLADARREELPARLAEPIGAES